MCMLVKLLLIFHSFSKNDIELCDMNDLMKTFPGQVCDIRELR